MLFMIKMLCSSSIFDCCLFGMGRMLMTSLVLFAVLGETRLCIAGVCVGVSVGVSVGVGVYYCQQV